MTEEKNNNQEIAWKGKVEELLEQIRPALVRDGGNVDLVEIKDDGTVFVELQGACAGCPMSQMTLKLGIEQHLKKYIPEVKSVENI